MIYTVSDIHGCYDRFLKLLEKIHFSPEDEMYILGDMIDRGDQPIALLEDLMSRDNIYPLLGNHEFMANLVLKKFTCEITTELLDSLREEDLNNYRYWMMDGGEVTLKQFTSLNKEQQQDILDYFQECSLYEKLEVNGKKYILVHADWKDEQDIETMIFHRPDFTKQSEEHTTIIIGHTPTPLLREDRQPLVFKKNGFVDIDCGCVFGGHLAAYCLDDDSIIYE